MIRTTWGTLLMLTGGGFVVGTCIGYLWRDYRAFWEARKD